ncbi:MAG: tRNA (adenine(22)-N(1))-methyltransferase TrmK [Staphylococcus equorum]|uniref:tRNA (adenine(22)-N(1))-methyltransferase n=1 Tax=Staphylococcus TaxID=1279 RepID=UPI000623CECD|nr:tRNA (adenine(22)-N(1))-methyltransferase TrmK [Staphylococcus equorum]KKI54460.1 putative tRNA-m1A22 methylase [Staphylococcus equorum subsp. equorum]MDG0822211.1 tRNA (adenine(22)-N(1))-methyltransferase TrmK [Staphylococcus equorum]MDG0838133.1 tRNA (adenine(22)-N(1))-methyltransferase TrmK [Staphylococcus equorum]MDK9870950.1 tRNA (adenine(22)-N(1))-methyltransferase TrmK [Staphylococcus equorum]MDK9876346.1 tRNA (adenine(22)-N(1))-methyltransferase TrmK [Staphylococcus equorum]
MIPLNQRLKKVSTYIQGDCLADIGSDHAYLPIFAIENNLTQKAIAGEVIKGPFEASKRNVIEQQLHSVIDVRLGDGLSVIQKSDDISSITICGMGGPLIAKILDEGSEKLTNQPRLILQSNIQSSAIRKQLVKMNYSIIAEDILEEKGHIYEIIVADYLESVEPLSSQALKFGPELLKNKNNLFFKKWERERDALYKIQQNLNPQQHAERLNEINNEINLINEVI